MPTEWPDLSSRAAHRARLIGTRGRALEPPAWVQGNRRMPDDDTGEVVQTAATTWGEALAFNAAAALVSVAASVPPISIWLPVGVPETNVQATSTPLMVIVLVAAGWPEKMILPVAATAVVVGSPNNPVSRNPLPDRVAWMGRRVV